MNEMVNNSEILEKINRIRKPVNDVYAYVKEYKENDTQKEKTKKLYKKVENKNPIGIAIAILFVGFFILLYIIYSYGSLTGKITAEGIPDVSYLKHIDFRYIVAWLILNVIIAVIVYCSEKIKKKRKMDCYEKQLKELECKSNEYKVAVEKILEQIQDDLTVIPPDYQYPLAIEYIYSCIRNQRAASMGEAINLYEDQLHKWRMEQMQSKLVEMSMQQQVSLEKIRKASDISAVANVATAAAVIFSN